MADQAKGLAHPSNFGEEGNQRRQDQLYPPFIIIEGGTRENVGPNIKEPLVWAGIKVIITGPRINFKLAALIVLNVVRLRFPILAKSKLLEHISMFLTNALRRLWNRRRKR